MANEVLKIENANILFPNFAGNETQYNRAGDRNFCVEIDETVVNRLVKDGWNVKTLAPRDEEEEEKERYYIQVSVSFRNRPPKIMLITRRAKTELDEESVKSLDFLDYRNDVREVDLIISPYNWEVNGKSGVKGYLKTAYVEIEEDEFAEKYADRECRD